MTFDQAVSLVEAERTRQQEKYSIPHAWGTGDCSSADLTWLVKAAMLSEKCGDVSRAVLDPNRPSLLRDEVTRVAAVAIAMLEGMSHYEIGR
jgi:hypothetical protein